jgi:hypothetical protein
MTPSLRLTTGLVVVNDDVGEGASRAPGVTLKTPALAAVAGSAAELIE